MIAINKCGSRVSNTPTTLNAYQEQFSMCIYCTTNNYRKIYEHHNGPIPVDEDGRTYEIHHIDGNRANNDPSNLLCVSIREHYDIHFSQGDLGACWAIASRMRLSPEHISELARQQNKQQIGPKNPFWGRNHSDFTKSLISAAKKGKPLSEETRRKQSLAHKGRPAWNKGVPIRAETKAKISRNNAKTKIKTWHVTHPCGKEEIVTDRVQFCKDYNLIYSSLNTCTLGGRPYKGYLFREVNTNQDNQSSGRQ